MKLVEGSTEWSETEADFQEVVLPERGPTEHGEGVPAPTPGNGTLGTPPRPSLRVTPREEVFGGRSVWKLGLPQVVRGGFAVDVLTAEGGVICRAYGTTEDEARSTASYFCRVPEFFLNGEERDELLLQASSAILALLLPSLKSQATLDEYRTLAVMAQRLLAGKKTH